VTVLARRVPRVLLLAVQSASLSDRVSAALVQ
jgi:hypothetical protein